MRMIVFKLGPNSSIGFPRLRYSLSKSEARIAHMFLPDNSLGREFKYNSILGSRSRRYDAFNELFRCVCFDTQVFKSEQLLWYLSSMSGFYGGE